MCQSSWFLWVSPLSHPFFFGGGSTILKLALICVISGSMVLLLEPGPFSNLFEAKQRKATVLRTFPKRKAISGLSVWLVYYRENGRKPSTFEFCLGFAVVPFYPFLGEGSPTKIDYRQKIGYPYSNLSAGGPRILDNPQMGNHLQTIAPKARIQGTWT